MECFRTLLTFLVSSVLPLASTSCFFLQCIGARWLATLTWPPIAGLLRDIRAVERRQKLFVFHEYANEVDQHSLMVEGVAVRCRPLFMRFKFQCSHFA